MSARFLGPYRVIDTLGRGASGQVFRVEAPDGSQVALKLLTQTMSPEARARFRREGELLSSLPADAGFVTLLDAGETPHGPYVVMPLLRGGSLRDRFQREGRSSVADAVGLGRELAAALANAHQRGIVHRDLKPSNVLFDEEGRAWIADLGLAKVFTREGEQLSQTGSLRGTVGYMPAEQMADAKRAGPQADVFAWGAILFEALEGERAFGEGPPLEVISRIEAGRYSPLGGGRDPAPAELRALIERCLALDPRERPRDGGELLAALEDALLLSSSASRPPPPALLVGVGLGLLLLGLGIGLLLPGQPESTRASAPASPAPSASPAATPSAAPSRSTPPPAPAPSATPAPAPSATPAPAPSATPAPSPSAGGSLPMLGSYRGRHLALVTDVAWDATGKTLASVGMDGFLRLWDPDTGERRQSFNFSRNLHELALASDGSWAVFGGEGGAALMDLARPRAQPLPVQGRVLSLALVDEERAVALGVGEDLALVELPSRRLLWRKPAHPGEGGLNAVRWSPRRREIVTGWQQVKVWSLEGQLLRSYGDELPGKRVEDLALSPDGSRIYVASKESPLLILEREGSGPATPLSFESLRSPSPVVSLAVLPEGGLVSGHFNGALVASGPGGERVLGQHVGWVHSVAQGPGARIATASNDGTLQVWDLKRGPVWTPDGHRGAGGVRQVASFGERVYSLGVDGVRVWDLASSRELRYLPSEVGSLGSLPFALLRSPTGKHLAQIARQGVVATTLASGARARWSCPPEDGRIAGATFTSDDLILLSLESKRMVGIDLRRGGAGEGQTPKPLRASPGHLAFRYLPAERTYLVVYEDRIERWPEEGKGVGASLPFRVLRATFDPQGVLWLAGTGRFVCMVPLPDGKSLWTRDLSAHLSQIAGNPALSPDRRYVALPLKGDRVGVLDCTQEGGLRQAMQLPFELGDRATCLGWSESGELLVGTLLGPILRYRLP